MAEPTPAAPAASARTIKVTVREDRSALMWIVQRITKLLKSKLVKPGKVFPSGSQSLQPASQVTKRCDVQEHKVEGIYIYELRPKARVGLAGTGQDGAKQRRKRLYYFCGGGWQMPPSAEHWALAAHMAERLPDTVFSVVSYPLAPDSPAPVSFAPLMALYRRLLRDAHEAGEEVVLAGDSSGGNIVLCLTLAALAADGDDDTVPCPTALMVMSPSTDLRRHNPQIPLVAKIDPILTVKFINSTATKWRGEWDAGDPRVTPLEADVAPLARRHVRVHGVVGRHDILAPDAILFRERCNDAGVRGEWLEWDKQMHVFPLAFSYKLRESREALDWMIDVLRRT